MTGREQAIEFDGFVVGPEDTLVLLPRERITSERAAELRAQVPAYLHGRVLIVDGMDAKVLRATAGEQMPDTP